MKVNFRTIEDQSLEMYGINFDCIKKKLEEVNEEIGRMFEKR